MTIHQPPILAAMQKLSAPPRYQTEVTRTGRVDLGGILRVEDASELQAAMNHWRNSWLGYEPRIQADGTDPCLAVWSRWNTCE